VRAALLVITASGVAALGVRLARSRHRRSLHPDGRSFTGELEVWGLDVPVGSDLIDRPGQHQVTIRLSKGVGTRPGRRDIRGVAIRVHGSGRGPDLLLSTTGTGRVTRHVPAPRNSFDACYGSITSYRSGSGRKVYLTAGPDPEGLPLGPTLESVAAAAEHHGARLLLYVDHDVTDRPFGRVRFGSLLPPATDAALAFDPIRNSSTDLHPSGTIHGVRAFAYRLSQRWRGAAPAPDNPAAVARTAEYH
jgi:hypothetical protein